MVERGLKSLDVVEGLNEGIQGVYKVMIRVGVMLDDY